MAGEPARNLIIRIKFHFNWPLTLTGQRAVIRPRVFDFVIAVGERLTFPPGALKSLRALRPRYGGGGGTRSAKENDGRQRGGIKRA